MKKRTIAFLLMLTMMTSVAWGTAGDSDRLTACEWFATSLTSIYTFFKTRSGAGRFALTAAAGLVLLHPQLRVLTYFYVLPAVKITAIFNFACRNAPVPSHAAME